MGRLTDPAHERFAKHYVALRATRPRGAQAEAARRAGFSHVNASQEGYRLSNRDDVSQRIDELMAMAFAPDDVDMDMVKRGIMREAMTAPRPSDRLRAWELIGKSLGGFRDVTVHEAMQTMTDQELALHAAGGDKDIAEQLLHQVQGHA